jgi:hypothetical protein
MVESHPLKKKTPCRPAMVPMNFMWCSSQWIHRFLKHLNISWDDDRLRRATGDWPWPPLLSLRTVADPIRNDGAGGAWSTWCPEELELKSSNISTIGLRQRFSSNQIGREACRMPESIPKWSTRVRTRMHQLSTSVG